MLIRLWKTSLAAWLVLTLSSPLPLAFALTIYDLSTDWSDANNPNGVWAYNDGGGALTNHVASWLPGDFANPQPAWAHAASGPGHIVSWFKSTNDGLLPVCADCVNTDWQVGDVITHTWDGVSSGGVSTSPSSVTWTSPTTGTVDISGVVWLARNIGRAINWNLLINGVPVTGGALSDGDPFDRANPFNLAAGSGGAGVLTDVPVVAGEQIALSFLTQSSAGEFTGMNLHIELTPGTTPVPEPATLFLVGLGALGFGVWHRRFL